VLLGLLSAWAASGGAGTLSKVRIQVVSAAVPMRAFTPEAADAVTTAQAFLAIRNLSGRPDELIAVSSPIARRVVLTRRAVPGGAASVVSSLVIPAGRTIALSPLSDGVVLQDPSPFEASGQVPLTLVFRDAGAITIEAPVTGPGTP
jgi:copper(I)-binding protein